MMPKSTSRCSEVSEYEAKRYIHQVLGDRHERGPLGVAVSAYTENCQLHGHQNDRQKHDQVVL